MQSPVTKRRAKRQTVHFTTHIKPSVKTELQRIAQAEGLPTSRVGAVAIEEWLARRSHVQHRGIFQPMIERAIAKEMRAYSSRLVLLLVRSMFEAGQTRTLVANMLGRQPGVTQETLDHILDYSRDVAKRNITRVTPQLEGLITEIEQWLLQGEAQSREG
jgi:hypothetical protein